jgi:hypothetical protein
MKVFTKILASIGLFLLYGLLNQLVVMANGRTSAIRCSGINSCFGLHLWCSSNLEEEISPRLLIQIT